MQVCLTNGDYQIGFFVRSFEYKEPQNTLADSSCCDSACTDDICCQSTNITCSPTIRICVRESNHPSDDRESSCIQTTQRSDGVPPLITLSTGNGEIERYYTVK